jgi:2-polyprenyl-6-methoxyphenol hydroxylase-like FAD-dependent oxidoreductase
MIAAPHKLDVCIMGAGLSGLTLARQLQRAKPELSIALIEHRRYPVPEAAHKVGESTVEIASHYLSEALGLKDHLKSAQLPKFGLRLFFRGDEPVRHDLSCYDEVGPSRVLPIPTFQLDRGRFENHLAERCRADGVLLLLDGGTIRSINPQTGRHQVTWRNSDGESCFEARYLVDASGRRSLLRNQLNLARPTHHDNHAVWFRVDGDIELELMSTNTAWLNRCHGQPRRLSTNHFTGPGYWVWLIPLASGTTSVGVVFDPKWLNLDQVNNYDRFMHWLDGEHPLIAAAVAGRAVLDFHVLKQYSHGCRQTLDSSGWMITGDAGPFTDPFYSPGSDFIAFANSFVTDIIVKDAPASVYSAYQTSFNAFFSNTLSIYRGMYGCMGHRDLMTVKTLWDYTYYWAVLSKLFFTGRFTDDAFMREARPVLISAAALNSGMQRQLRASRGFGARRGGESGFFDYHAFPLFHRLKNDLLRGDSENALGELQEFVRQSTGVAQTLHDCLDRLNEYGEAPDQNRLLANTSFS